MSVKKPDLNKNLLELCFVTMPASFAKIVFGVDSNILSI